jgi:hypothetical protein
MSTTGDDELRRASQRAAAARSQSEQVNAVQSERMCAATQAFLERMYAGGSPSVGTHTVQIAAAGLGPSSSTSERLAR